MTKPIQKVGTLFLKKNEEKFLLLLVPPYLLGFQRLLLSAEVIRIPYFCASLCS